MASLVKHLLIVGIMLICAVSPGFAASNWITMEERANAIYQINTESVQFSGDGSDKQLEVWMKNLDKDGSGSYLVGHYLVKENGLKFILKERTGYSANGVITSTFQNSSDNWIVTTPASPIGSIAMRIFAEYHKSPDSFNSKNLSTNPERAEPLPAVNQETAATSEIAEITVDPNEVKKALDDGQIKVDNSLGSRDFYVRDRRGPALFSGITHYMTADFCLSIDANSKRTKKLKFSTEDTRAGVHRQNEVLTILIDGKDWALSSPLRSNAYGHTSANYLYAYRLPEPLIQALAVTKAPVILKWKHEYNYSWEDRERIIPDKVLRAIQLMYIGCK